MQTQDARGIVRRQQQGASSKEVQFCAPSFIIALLSFLESFSVRLVHACVSY